MKRTVLLSICSLAATAYVWAAPVTVIQDIDDKTLPEDFGTRSYNLMVGYDPADGNPSMSSQIIGLPANLVSVQLSGSGTNRTVQITSTANLNGTVTIQLNLSNSGGSAQTDFEVEVTPENDTPTLSGNFDATIPDTADIILFSSASIGDVDHNQPDPVNLTLTVEVAAENSVGLFEGMVNGVYTLNGPPVIVQSALRSLTFQPYANAVAVGSSQALTVDIRVEDGQAAEATRSGTITVQNINDVPTATLTLDPDTTFDNGIPIQPFHLDISDPDPGESFSVTIRSANDPSGQHGTLNPDPAVFSGGDLLIESNIELLSYTPVSGAGAASVTFEVEIYDSHEGGATYAATTPLTILSDNDSPSILGVELNTIRITDRETTRPFPAVIIEDHDAGAELSVEVSYDSTFGTLDETMTTGSPSAVSAWIQGLVFTPRTNAVPVGFTEAITFTISADDGIAPPVSDNKTKVAVTGTDNNMLAILVPIVQPKDIDPADPRPFVDTRIAGATSSNLTMEILIDDAAKGFLSSNLFSGSADEINTALQQITYTTNNYLFPPGMPGYTVFTLRVTDDLNHEAEETLKILLQPPAGNIVVTSTDDDINQPGTLRYAVAKATNNDTITFAFNYPKGASVPKTIQLTNGIITLDKNLNLKGSGADLLVISGDADGDRQGDSQIFRIEADVTLEGLTLAHGKGQFGGAISIGSTGGLAMRNCTITNCEATLWGGAIDVEEGWLAMEGCSLLDNSTGPASGLGGGAISLWTDQDCGFLNTTFSGNRQASPSGYGGGAIYAENYTPATYLDIGVAHCTFTDNADDALVASSIYANGFGTQVNSANSIYADGHGHNLDVAGAADIVSHGGNISDDSTYTLYMQGGQPQAVILLNHAFDLINTDPLLEPLAMPKSPTFLHPLHTNSPAIGWAVTGVSAIDQRGALRHAFPDSGSFELDAEQRIVINEIQLNGNPFIEFFVPRNADPIDLTGFILLVDDVPQYTFPSNTLVDTGFGLILANSEISGYEYPSTVIAPVPFVLEERGTIALADPASNIVERVAYNSVFEEVDTFTPSAYSGHSLTLAPQYRGFANLPHGWVGADPESPGADADGTPFGLDNAPPIAFDDDLVVNEDDVSWIAVLANDYDADGDLLVITGLPSPDQTTTTWNGATCTVAMAGSDFGVWYNPLQALDVQQLPVGTELAEGFTYTIADAKAGGSIDYLGNYDGVLTLVTVEPHGLAGGESIYLAFPDGRTETHMVENVLNETEAMLDTWFDQGGSNGVWYTLNGTTDEGNVNLTVLGANDAPEAHTDSDECDEDEPLTFTSADLLWNDDDIDTDDDNTTLEIVGILQSTSTQGATVAIDIRANPTDTTISYDPAASATLDALADGESFADTFQYVVSDSHGALGTGTVVVTVYGVNDTPISGDDPAHLAPLLPYLDEGETLDDLFNHMVVLDAVPATAGGTGRMDARIVITNKFTEANSIVLTNVWGTLASQTLYIDAAQILANDTDVDASDTLSITSAAVSFAGVDARIGAGGNVQYAAPESARLVALARGELLMDWFDVVIDDGHGGQATNTVAVLVTGVNDRPFAGIDTFDLLEHQPIVFNAMTNDHVVDTDGSAPDNQLWIVPATGESTHKAAYTITSNGVAIYNPALSAILDGLPEGYVTNDTFTYELTDQSFVFACDDLFRVDADSTGAVLRVMVNDINHNTRWGAIHIAEIGIPDNGGSVDLHSNNTSIIYQPQINFIGDEVFTYTITDPFGNIDKARVTVRVTSETLNGDLQANADFYTVALGETTTLDVLANDNRLPATGAELEIVALNTNGIAGTVQLSTDSLGYTGSMVGTDTFSYAVSGGGTSRKTAAVVVNVVDRRNTLPVRNDHFAILRNSLNKTLDVLANDRILPDTPGFELVEAGQPQNGTASIINNELRYTPTSGFVGIDRFSYTITDNRGGTGTAWIEVHVGALLAKQDVFSAGYDADNMVLDVLANDRILPEAVGSLSITATLEGDDLSGYIDNHTNHLVFTAPPEPAGSYEFDYVVSDGSAADGLSVTGAVAVVIEPDGAYANPDYLTVRADSSGIELDVLNNDASVGFDRTMVVTAIGTGDDAPNHGGTAVVAGQADHIVYTPAPGFTGEETFTYTMTDSAGSDSARVVVEVRPPEMTACDDAFVVYFDTNTPAFILPVLHNDGLLPPGGASLQIENADIDITADGLSLEFTPGFDTFPYTTTIAYEIGDGTERRESAMVEIEVRLRAGQLALEANTDVFSVARNSSANRMSPLANDGVLPGSADEWVLEIITPCTNGGIAAVAGSDILFTPARDFTGTDGFAYSVSDGLGGTATNTVFVRVGEILLNADCFVALSGTTNAFDVLANDGRQPDGTVLTNLVGGTNGLFIYIPPASNDSPFVDRVDYVVLDDSGIAATQQVSVLVVEHDSDRSIGLVEIEVTGVNDPPIVDGIAELVETDDDTPIQLFPTASVVDVDLWSNEIQHLTLELDDTTKGMLAPLTGFTETAPGKYEMLATPAEVTATLEVLVFTPVENRIPSGLSERTDLDITITDQHVTHATPVEIVVWSVNDPPVVSGIIDPLSAIDDGSVHPFPFAEVLDVDENGQQQLIARIEVGNPAISVLTSLGGFVQTTADTYEMIGTPSAISAALKGLQYVPAGSPLPVGTSVQDWLDLQVTDLLVASPTQANINLTVYGQGTFMNSWRALELGSTHPTNRVDSADPDGDGLINIAEYAFGTDPLIWNSGTNHCLSIAASASSAILEISHRRRTDNPTLIYMLEASTDFATWKPVFAWLVKPPEAAEPGMETATFASGMDEQSYRYYRIRVYN